MILSGLDTETTGLDTANDRIVEIALVLYEYPSKRCLGKFVREVQPLRSISPEAYAVHGISAERLANAPTFDQIVDPLLKLLSRTHLLVAHNGNSFDIPLLANEIIRAGREVPNIMALDTMREAPWATADGKMPTLRELCFACDVPYDVKAAHAAEYDVMRMMECVLEVVDQGFFKEVREMHEELSKCAA